MEPFIGSGQEWNELIARLPHPHLLQTWEWAKVKEKYGWKPRPMVWRDPAGGTPVAAGMILERTVSPLGFAARLRVLYTPKGPNLNWENAELRRSVWKDLQAYARQRGAIFSKVDPDVELGTGVPGTADALEDGTGANIRNELSQYGWLFSQDQIQFRNTCLIDLQGSEDELLAAMKQKTRYNIRLAEKKGVKVRTAAESDLPILFKMYAETSVRDGFLIRSEDYYQTVWQTFQTGKTDRTTGDDPISEPLIAEVDGQPVAAISLFYFGRHAYYIFGMSRNEHRDLMPNYLLQWRAIQRAKELGCLDYNLWGAPNDFQEADPLWGVFRFKEGLGGKVYRSIGAWDYPASPLMYRLYTQVLPRIMSLMRARGKAKTRQSLGGI